jgi:hypothetical protein
MSLMDRLCEKRKPACSAAGPIRFAVKEWRNQPRLRGTYIIAVLAMPLPIAGVVGHRASYSYKAPESQGDGHGCGWRRAALAA